MPVKQRRTVVPVTKKKPTAAIVLVVGSVACIFLAVVVFALSAYSFSKQTSGVNQQIAGSPSGNVPPAPEAEAAPTDPVYFEMARDGNLTRLHKSGRIYIRYSGSSAFQEVKPSAWAYGFYAYMVLFQKAYVHGKDKEFEQVLARVDRLADSNLGSGVPDVDVFRESTTYVRLEGAIRAKLEKRANEEFGLPLDQSTYSDWREALRSGWIEFAEDIRTSMSSFGSSYLHRLTSVYIHERLFELEGGFDKTVEVYQNDAYLWAYMKHPYHEQLILKLEKEAKDFNAKLYGLDSGRQSRPVVAREPTPSRPEIKREPAPKPAEPPRPIEPTPDDEVENEPTTPEPKPDTAPAEPATPHQGELSITEMRDRLTEISGIESSLSLTKEQRAEQIKSYGRSWSSLLLEVTGTETVPLWLDFEEASIYRLNTKEALQINLGRSWFTLDEHEKLVPVHTIPPISLLAPEALSQKLALKLNELNTADRKVKRYFYPRTPASRLKAGSFVQVWLELDCSSGVAIVRYDVLESPESLDPSSDDAETKDDVDVQAESRSRVRAKLEPGEITIDEWSKKAAQFDDIQNDQDLSVREREQLIKDLGKGWCYVGVYVNSATSTWVWLPKNSAKAMGLESGKAIEAIILDMDERWYDPRTGDYRRRWFNYNPKVQGIKGMTEESVDIVNATKDENRGWFSTLYVTYDAAADMKRGDAIVVKFSFDFTSGEYIDQLDMTQLAPRVALRRPD